MNRIYFCSILNFLLNVFRVNLSFVFFSVEKNASIDFVNVRDDLNCKIFFL